MCLGVGQQILILKFFYSFTDDIFILIRYVFKRHHKDVTVVVSCHDDCGVPPGVPERVSAQKRVSMRRTRCKPERLIDLLGFNTDQSILKVSKAC